MNRKIFRLVSSLFLAVIVSVAGWNIQPVRAVGSWYVAPTGDDNNDCLSPGSACATINGAIGKASAGDTIYVAIGTYTGTGSAVVWINNDLILSGGWSSDFTTQNGLSTIDGQNERTGISAGLGLVDHFRIMNGYSFYGAGGIEAYGSLTLDNSIVINNRAAGYSTGSAGGIFAVGDLTLNNSTVQGNISGGRAGGILLYVNNKLTLNNSTITWNQATNEGGGIVFSGGSGGGDAPVATILNSTISNNIAQAGGGMIIEGWSPAREVNISNSIIANNSGPTDGPDCYGEITTLDHSIVGNSAGCTVPSGTGNLVNINPLISTYPVGSVAYHTLLTGSPAIDAGNSATCLGADQRGVTRPQGSACDIGAYEYTTPGTAASLSVVGGGGQLTGTTLAFPKPLQAAVLDSQGSPVSGVTIDFVAPGSGASGTFADTSNNTTSVDTDAGGVATTSVFTANNQEGTYTVSASAIGLGTVTFSLEQVIRPANDNFANAIAITSLPFSDSQDNTRATTESGEPHTCFNSPNTVWYSFTPTTNVLASVDMAASSFGDIIVNIYKDEGSGMSGLSSISCGYSGNLAILTFEAGVTYYLQAGSIDAGGGILQIDLQEIPPPTNDDFANASPISSLPSTTDFTNLAATTESGEPGLSCDFGSPSAQSTVWFSFTATHDETISASISNSTFTPVWAVYGGTNLNDLTEVGCRNYESLSWRAIAGQTYYIQVSGLYGGSGTGTLSLDIAALPQPYFYFDPSDPSNSEIIQFYDASYDPAGIGIETWEWDFGDGTPYSTDQYPTHIYAAGGDYNVTLTITTFDGRSASVTQMIQVRTQFVFTIDIKPGSQTNPINMKSVGKIPVAILSTPDFNAVTDIDKTSLTFGSTGYEHSLVSCNRRGTDVNGDGLKDLVCHFKTKLTGFKLGDTEGILRGRTLGGVTIEARDVVRVLQASYP